MRIHITCERIDRVSLCNFLFIFDHDNQKYERNQNMCIVYFVSLRFSLCHDLHAELVIS